MQDFSNESFLNGHGLNNLKYFMVHLVVAQNPPQNERTVQWGVNVIGKMESFIK